ncbi:MAG: DNA-directed RNA polymerase subunit omega [Vicinamibacterales bacterium]
MKKSRFETAAVAGARARQLLDGCTPRVEPASKTAKTALREVASGAVTRVEPNASTKGEGRMLKYKP